MNTIITLGTQAVALLNNSAAIIAQAQAVLTVEIEALQALHARIDETFVRAIAVLESTVGRIIVTGMGKSGHIGRKIAATLSSTGSPAYFLHPAEGRHGDLGQVTATDVVIAISNSGETEEVLGLLPTLKQLGVPIVALTARGDSTLAKIATVVLDITVPQEACGLGLAPTASTTVTLALGDALAVVLQQRKGFAKEDFALFHPAGSLGKRLLLKVSDLMITGDKLPIITPEMPFLQALITISEKQLGMAIVVDPNTQLLLGVLTDGDVRRAFQRFAPETVHQLTVEAVIGGKHPKTIVPTALAAEALTVMEQFKITALVVQATPQTPPVGVVHLHELLKSGL
jgi:arabinose-5-phosphate isomerase